MHQQLEVILKRIRSYVINIPNILQVFFVEGFLVNKEMYMKNYMRLSFVIMIFSMPVLASEQLNLSLEKTIQMAIERNERSQIADYELRQAQLNYKEVRSGIFPAINAELSTQKASQKPALFSVITGDNPATNKLFDNYTQGGTISIVQPVYTFGRLSGAIDAAKFQNDIAK